MSAKILDNFILDSPICVLELGSSLYVGELRDLELDDNQMMSLWTIPYTLLPNIIMTKGLSQSVGWHVKLCHRG